MGRIICITYRANYFFCNNLILLIFLLDVHMYSTLLQGFRLFPTYVMLDAGPQHKSDGLSLYPHVEFFRQLRRFFPTLSFTRDGFVLHFTPHVNILTTFSSNFPVNQVDFSRLSFTHGGFF
jgi:hypothetical protein